MNNICNAFKIDGAVASVMPLGEGFINDTYVVKNSDPTKFDYILQRKNGNIFKNIPDMVSNIDRVTAHLKKKITEAGGKELRETITLIKTLDEKLYYKDDKSNYWVMMILIPETITYSKADSIELAFKGGAGIGKFQSLLADFKESLVDILPGFHNMRFRFEQWDDTLRRDPLGRVKELSNEISWIESRREEMLAFWALYEMGELPQRVTHNDTKISNILFDQHGEVQSVIDLDTVLNATCLNDFGDAIRSYTNSGDEDDENLDRVSMDLDIFRAYTNGYLSEAKEFLNSCEKENLAYSARYITFEQVLRFLMDYIDGDNYYKIKSPRHNLIRTRAQYKLLQSMEAQYDKMVDIVNQTLLSK